MADAYLTEVALAAISKSGWSGADWQSAEIATAHSITPPCVLEIQCANGRTGTGGYTVLGAREEDSSIERKLTLERAKTGGERTYQTFVQLGSNGYIELYDDNVNDTFNYYISGYWTNTSFTEAWQVETLSTVDTWEDHTINATYADRCAHTIGRNYHTNNQRLGMRINGSLLDRRTNFTDAYANDGTRCVAFGQCVKLDGSGIAELFFDHADTDIVIGGYFGTAIDYVEIAHHSGGFTGTAGVWETEDLSDQWLGGDADADILAVDYCILHQSDSPVYDVGLRDPDGSLDRQLTICEREGAQKHGIHMHTLIDNTNGQIEHYSTLDPNYNSWMYGYIKMGTEEPTGWGHKINSISSPAEVDSVLSANIDKVNNVQ